MPFLEFGTGGTRCSDFFPRILQTYRYLFLATIGFILLTAILVMNMLIGVLCEVVSVISVTEKDSLLAAYSDPALEDHAFSLFGAMFLIM